MNNVIQFRAKPKEPTYTVTDDIFFISCLQTAANVAAYVHHDEKAVELLINAMREMYLSGDATTYLDDETRRICARYLSEGEHKKQDITKSIEFIYS